MFEIHCKVRAELALAQCRTMIDLLEGIRSNAPKWELNIHQRAMEVLEHVAREADSARAALGLPNASQVVEVAWNFGRFGAE